MSNATHTRMIPYPVIEAAVCGDTDAVNEVIRHYSGYIAALCKRTTSDRIMRLPYSYSPSVQP